jgi:hypothetical protein
MQRAPSPPVSLGSSLILYLFKEPTYSVQRSSHRLDDMEVPFLPDASFVHLLQNVTCERDIVEMWYRISSGCRVLGSRDGMSR